MLVQFSVQVISLVDAAQGMAVATATASVSSVALSHSSSASLDPLQVVRTLSSGETGLLWDSVNHVSLALQQLDLSQFFSIAGAPAYATG
jgi:hypothetical protein